MSILLNVSNLFQEHRVLKFISSSVSGSAQRRRNIVHPRGSTMGSGYHQVASSPDRGSIVSKCGDQKTATVLCLVSNGPSHIGGRLALRVCPFLSQAKRAASPRRPGCRSGVREARRGGVGLLPSFSSFFTSRAGMEIGEVDTEPHAIAFYKKIL